MTKVKDSDLVERLKAGQDLLRLFVSSWNPRQSGKTSAGQLIVDINEAITALQAPDDTAQRIAKAIQASADDYDNAANVLREHGQVVKAASGNVKATAMREAAQIAEQIGKDNG